jgi:hypothetical protein
MGFDNFAGATGRAISDVGKGFVEGAVEQPLNALIEVGEHVIRHKLGRVDLVQPTENSLATATGQMAGKVLDIFLLSKAVGAGYSHYGISETGIGSTMLRMGTTGMIYGTMLDPTGDKPGNFFYNRIANGLTEGATWAAIGGTTSALEGGKFVQPAQFRTLRGYVTLGAMSGVAGGIVHSETNSLLHTGQFASAREVAGDSLAYGVSGGMFGALNFGTMKFSQMLGKNKTDLPTKFTTDEGETKVTVARNASGKVAGVRELDTTFSPGTVGGSIANEMYVPKNDGAGWERRYGFPMRDAEPVRTVGQLTDGSVVVVGPTTTYPRLNQGWTNITLLEAGKGSVHATIGTAVGEDIATATGGKFINGELAAADGSTITRFNCGNAETLTVPQVLEKVRGVFGN